MLAAPCCHHDIAAQLRKAPTPAPYAMLTRHGILRERLADTLTDGLRASLLRLEGYRVDVMQFVESQHTPRNTMLRAVRTGGPVKGGGVRKEYDDLVDRVGHRARGSPSCWGEPRSVGMRDALVRRRAGRPVRPRRRERPGRRRASRCSASATRRSSSRAGYRAGRRPRRHHQRLRGHRPGVRGRPGHRARPSASPVGGATRTTSRRSPRPATARSGSATSATTPTSRDSVEVTRVPVGRGDRTVDADDLRARLPRRPGGRGVAARRPDDRAALRRHQGRLRRRAVRRAAHARRRRAQPAAAARRRCCRSPPTARSSPTASTSSCATTPARPSTRSPALAEVGSFRLPDQQQGEGIAVDADGSLLVSSEGQHAPVLRVPLPADVRRGCEWPPSPSPSSSSAPRRRRPRPRTPSRAPASRCPRPSRPSARGGRGSSPPGSRWAAWCVLVRSLRPR